MKNRTMILLLLLCLMVPSEAFAVADLRSQSGELVAASEGQAAVEGQDGWLFLREELEHLAAGRFWGEDAAGASRTRNTQEADPLAAIVAYNEQLAARNITLYLMPVPPKALVYGDKLAPGVNRAMIDDEMRLYQEFYQDLAARGVKVIDLLPELMAARDTTPVYCLTDTHFSPAGMHLFAEAARAAIAGEPWYQEQVKTSFSRTAETITIHGDLARMADQQDRTEELAITLVRDEKGQSVQSDEGSPVILLGDSHTLVFHAGGDLHAKDGGLFEHLSAELGFGVDLLGVRGSGVTPARIKLYQRSKKDGGYLDGKKALIWCFAAREFTGSGGWKKIPVAP